MPEDMSEEMSEDMSEKNDRKNVRIGRQKICQKRMSEDMSEKGCQKIRPKKCHKERLYWTVSIELQAPRRLKTDVATAILA